MDIRTTGDMMAIVLNAAYSPDVSQRAIGPQCLPVKVNTVSYSLNLQKRSILIIIDEDGVTVLICGLGNLELSSSCLDYSYCLGIISSGSQSLSELLASAANHLSPCGLVGEGNPVEAEWIAVSICVGVAISIMATKAAEGY